MGAFVNDGLFHSGETVKDHSAGATFDVVDGSLSKGEADGEGNGVTVDGTESVGHGEAESGGGFDVEERMFNLQQSSERSLKIDYGSSKGLSISSAHYVLALRCFIHLFQQHPAYQYRKRQLHDKRSNPTGYSYNFRECALRYDSSPGVVSLSILSMGSKSDILLSIPEL